VDQLLQLTAWRWWDFEASRYLQVLPGQRSVRVDYVVGLGEVLTGVVVTEDSTSPAQPGHQNTRSPKRGTRTCVPHHLGSFSPGKRLPSLSLASGSPAIL
jgi:hypothetical protein